MGRLSDINKRILEIIESVSLMNLIAGFKEYLNIFWGIIKSPRMYLGQIDFSSGESYEKSMRFFYFSLILRFFILIPAMYRSDNYFSKVSYIAVEALGFFISVMISIVSMRIIGGCSVAAKTNLAYGMLSYGFYSVAYTIITYPRSYYCGPDSNLAGRAFSFCDFSRHVESSYLIVIFILVAVMSVVVMISWWFLICTFCEIHKVSKRRYFLLHSFVIFGLIAPYIFWIMPGADWLIEFSGKYIDEWF